MAGGRKTYVGTATQTTLAGAINSTDTTVTLVDASTYGTPTVGAPMVIVIGADTTAEEQLLISARSGNVLTVAASGRNWHAGGGTTGVTHAVGEVVRHVLDADSIDDANRHVNVDTADDHSQYLNNARFDTRFGTAHAAVSHSVAFELPHTWAVAADIKVPSGDTDYLPGFFVPVPTGYTAKLTRARYRINGGTSATVKVQVNGADATGLTGISVTTTAAATDPADVTVADNDYVALVVTAVSGSPKNMTFTLDVQFARTT